MTVAASGIFALPLAYLKATIAASATFQAIVGAVDAPGALPHIFEGETDETAAADAKPRAIIDIAGNFGFDKVSSSGWLGAGDLQMDFEIPIPAAFQANFRDARRDFYNKAGAILAEMQVLCGQAGYLNILKFTEVVTGRADPKPNNQEQFFVGSWTVSYQG